MISVFDYSSIVDYCSPSKQKVGNNAYDDNLIKMEQHDKQVQDDKIQEHEWDSLKLKLIQTMDCDYTTKHQYDCLSSYNSSKKMSQQFQPHELEQLLDQSPNKILKIFKQRKFLAEKQTMRIKQSSKSIKKFQNMCYYLKKKIQKKKMISVCESSTTDQSTDQSVGIESAINILIMEQPFN